MFNKKADKILVDMDQRIKALMDESEDIQARIEATKARISAIKQEIGTVMDALLAARDTGDDVLAMDAKRRELRDESELLGIRLQGLHGQLEDAENKLSEAIEERNSRFAELAIAWLKGQARTFNGLVAQIQNAARRIYACHALLRESGQEGVFLETLGGGGRYLTELKLPVLGNGFVAGDLDRDRQLAALRPDRALIEQTFREVCER